MILDLILYLEGDKVALAPRRCLSGQALGLFVARVPHLPPQTVPKRRMLKLSFGGLEAACVVAV